MRRQDDCLKLYVINGDDNMTNNINDTDAQEKAKKNVRRAITAIYCGGVLFATVMYLSFVSEAFTSTLVALFGTAGALLTGLSAVTFLYAKDHWFSDGLHEGLGYTFWAIDLLMLGMNTVLAFVVSHAITEAQLQAVPFFNDVMSYWRVLSPTTPIIVIAMWAVLRAISPDSQLNRAMQRHQAKLIRKHAQYLEDEALNSAEAHDILKQAAHDLTLSNAKLLTGQMQYKATVGKNGQTKAPAVTMGSYSPEELPTVTKNGKHPKA